MPPVDKPGIARQGIAATCFILATLAALPGLAPYLSAFDAGSLGSDLNSLRRAHQIHPRSAQISVELALLLDSQDQPGEAAEILLQLAEHNHQYLPAWTLANYYYRHQIPEQFWRWARPAAERCYDDFRPLLRIALNLEADPALVAERLGRQPPLLRALIDVLIGDQRLEEASDIGQMLALLGDPADRLRLANLDHRLGARPQQSPPHH